MLESIKMWIISILIGAFIINIVDMILPKSKLKPYINVVLNFIFVFIVITPIITFISGEMSFEDALLKGIANYNKEYIESSNELSSKTGTNSLSNGYEDSLKSILELKLEEYGYEIEEIELNGSSIENIKLKEEKNSNKNNDSDIQSKESDNSKQVFSEKDKDLEHELDLSEDKLKEDLVEILDISIETIQID